MTDPEQVLRESLAAWADSVTPTSDAGAVNRAKVVVARRRRLQVVGAAAVVIVGVAGGGILTASHLGRSQDTLRQAANHQGPSPTPAPGPVTHPGTASPSPGTQPPVCTSRQLTVMFRGGGLGGGNSFGNLDIGNVTGRACVLTGSVMVRPLDRNRTPIRPYYAQAPLTMPSGIALSPRRPGAARGPETTATVIVRGGSRDDPRPPNQTCPAGALITPAFWELRTAGQVFIIENSDPSRVFGAGFAVAGCRANLTATTVIASAG